MDNRQIRGYSILAKGDTPKLISEEEFLVPSQSSNGRYKVTHKQEWTCECKDFKHRGMKCKHIHAVEFLLKMRAKTDVEDTIDFTDELNKPRCVFCGSENITKNGSRKTKAGVRQRYLCKDCKKRFVLDPIKHIKGNGKIVTLVMDLYYKGLSLRNITDTIYQFYGLKLHHETIRRWIMKFTVAMNNYVNQLQPKVSDVWHVDEQMVKVKGKWMWAWNCIDDETRFLIANTITKKRTIHEARQVFQNALDVARDVPEFLITDGLSAYKKAIKKEFGARGREEIVVKHVRAKSLREKRQHNNVVERFHGTFRERDKTMRGFKSKVTAKQLSDGFRTYYNFIRKHQGLKGLTPSQRASIDLNLGRNRWLSLVKKSLNSQKQV